MVVATATEVDYVVRTCFLSSISSLYSGMCFAKYIETTAFGFLARVPCSESPHTEDMVMFEEGSSR